MELPSLREFLDADCDLVESGVWLGRLAELVFLELPFMPPGARHEMSEHSRSITDVLLTEGQRCPDVPMWWARVVLEHWSAEVYEDPKLAEKLREALPSEVAAPYRALADLYRRPYPLEVRSPEGWWSCSNCGAAFDVGQEQALVITGREDHSELREEITYCFECLELLGEVVHQAEPRS